jgi:hypothetical protein
MTLELKADGKKSTSVGGSLRIRRGEVIQLSLAPLLGIEIGRAEITPDGMLVVDRINKRYVRVSFEELKALSRVDLTYDILRAIAFEINCGYSFEETLMDLNISKEGTPKYNIVVHFEDGHTRTVFNERVNTYSTDRRYFWFNGKSAHSGDSIRLDFSPSDIVIDMDHAEMTLDPTLVERYIDADYFDMDKPEEKARYDYLCSVGITKITFVRVIEDFAYKYVV